MKTVKVYEVVYTTGDDGKFGDGIGIFRTRSKADAEQFAAGKRLHSGEATADLVLVPANIARRWGL